LSRDNKCIMLEMKGINIEFVKFADVLTFQYLFLLS